MCIHFCADCVSTLNEVSEKENGIEKLRKSGDICPIYAVHTVKWLKRVSWDDKHHICIQYISKDMSRQDV